MPPRTAYHGPLGDAFADHAESGVYNAYVDRPAMLGLAGDVAGLRVLDAGCGAGFYAAELARRGARVTAVDGSETLLDHARTRVGDDVELRLHDLEAPFDFAESAAFDMVLCALVIHHVTDRAGLLAEFARLLRPGGALLVSTTHPAADWRRFGDSYFSREWVDLPVAGGTHAIHYQRSSLEEFLTEILGAGFALERLTEPRPIPALGEIDPEQFKALNERPSFLAVRLRKPPSAP